MARNNMTNQRCARASDATSRPWRELVLTLIVLILFALNLLLPIPDARRRDPIASSRASVDSASHGLSFLR
jgi:hypothetical protein